MRMPGRGETRVMGHLRVCTISDVICRYEHTYVHTTIEVCAVRGEYTTCTVHACYMHVCNMYATCTLHAHTVQYMR